jgi:hypothetical protein
MQTLMLIYKLLKRRLPSQEAAAATAWVVHNAVGQTTSQVSAP